MNNTNCRAITSHILHQCREKKTLLLYYYRIKNPFDNVAVRNIVKSINVCIYATRIEYVNRLWWREPASSKLADESEIESICVCVLSRSSAISSHGFKLSLALISIFNDLPAFASSSYLVCCFFLFLLLLDGCSQRWMGSQFSVTNATAKKTQQQINDGMHHTNSLNRAFNRAIDKDRVELPFWNDLCSTNEKRKKKARINSRNKRHIQIAMQTYYMTVFISLLTEIASIHIALTPI